MKTISNEDVLRNLRLYVFTKHNNSQRDFAKSIGKTDAFVSQILSGDKRIPNYVLKLIKVERQNVFVKIKG